MKRISIFIVLLTFVVSCGPSLETTTVSSDPAELLSIDTSRVETETDAAADDFVHLKLGEISKIHSLDPLFAESNSEHRVHNLVYEQLVGTNQLGNPSPELAHRWDVNNDSTQFTLQLRTDIYFHDSPVFGSGTGRRFTAQDVRFAFERMAMNEVPDWAAQLFSDIRGFNAFHKEQTLIKDPAKRVIGSIEGLKVRNDSTVIFILNESSDDFLERLAHPYASIYPRESIPAKVGPIQQAAGTGRFKFIQKNDNTHLFTTNKNYRGVTPRLNRLDIVSGLDERELYQRFARKDLDVLIEVSFPTIQTITDSSGTLLPQFIPIYKLQNSEVEAVHAVYYNESARQEAQVNNLLDSLSATELIGQPRWGDVEFLPLESNSAAGNQENRSLVSSRIQHHNEWVLFNNLANAAAGYGFTFTVTPSLAPATYTTFTTLPFVNTTPVIRWRAPVFVLSHASVEGLNIQHFPWELNLTSLQLVEAGQ
ncbi:MAG: hypothetical protein CL666_00375 [Balneola sp.]|nr:hypothetical protein [Balneola sp.]|tara:strand:- start:14891 stop:16327 length:1437 start_codon:yes stop_codon:yes gene_type:complete